MTNTVYFTHFDSPLGRLCICGDSEFVTGLYLPEHKGWQGPGARWEESTAPFGRVAQQLAEYFAGTRREFQVPMRFEGTSFQQSVWQELCNIPYGTTITYGQLAQRVGNVTASRAVGSANGQNPISILAPCHRVIGASGKLTGYAGGLTKKEWLLALEARTAGVSRQRLLEATTF